MRANSSLSLLKTLVMENSASVTLLSTTQYCSVARNRTRFECANEYGPLRGGGPEMLEHSELSRPRADRVDGNQRDGTERPCCRTLVFVPARSA